MLRLPTGLRRGALHMRSAAPNTALLLLLLIKDQQAVTSQLLQQQLLWVVAVHLQLSSFPTAPQEPWHHAPCEHGSQQQEHSQHQAAAPRSAPRSSAKKQQHHKAATGSMTCTSLPKPCTLHIRNSQELDHNPPAPVGICRVCPQRRLHHWQQRLRLTICPML